MFKLYYSKIVIFTIIVILNCGIGAAFAEKMPINIDLSACKGKADCVWDFGNGTKVKGCSDKKHTFSKSGINEVSVVLKCSGLTQKTTRTFDVKSGIIDNVDHECRYEEPWYDEQGRRQGSFSGVSKQNDGAIYKNRFIWEDEEVCFVDTQSCVVDGIRYFAGSPMDGVGDNVGGNLDWQICKEPASESIEKHHKWIVGSYESSCNACDDRQYRDTEWSPTIGCGNTTQTRTVSCINKYNKTVVDWGKCLESNKPSHERMVDLDTACDPVCKYISTNGNVHMIDEYGYWVWDDETLDCDIYSECTDSQFHYYEGDDVDCGGVLDTCNEICREPKSNLNQ